MKEQVMYLGRWVEKNLFRTFVYKANGESKLANSYDEFKSLISSGIWFDLPENIPKEEEKPLRKTKNAGISIS